MNKVVQRLLVFAIGIPAALSLALAQWACHLPLQITMLVFSLLGAAEAYKMFAKCAALPPLLEMLVMDALIMSSPYAFHLLKLPTHYVSYVFLLCVMLLLTAEATKGYSKYDKDGGADAQFTHTLKSMGLSTLLLFYCGYLFSFMSRLSLSPQSSRRLLLFLVIVFICDSCAWLFGVLLGKNNRHIVAASPNKSIAGFAGGILGSVIAALLCCRLLPSLFALPIWRYALLAFLTSLAAIVGDLVESVFKRSAGVKDSGQMMLGRGGILDSIDSILFSVPVYCLLVRYLI